MTWRGDRCRCRGPHCTATRATAVAAPLSPKMWVKPGKAKVSGLLWRYAAAATVAAAETATVTSGMCRFPRIRLNHRPAHTRSTAGTVLGGTAPHLAGRGVAAHHDVGIAALLEVRIEDRFAGRAPPRLGTLENQLFYTTTADYMSYQAIEISRVALGTAIARRPPHRSRRALLTHRAPPRVMTSNRQSG